MWIITRRVPAPRLRLVGGVIARQQGDRVTLLTLGDRASVELSLSSLPDAGHGIILQDGSGEPRLLARYATLRQARRQLERLSGPRGWGWMDGLGRASMLAVLCFVVWFLFFLPVDPAYRAAAAIVPGTGTPRDGTAQALPTHAVPAPAWIDDPAELAPAR